MDYCVPFYHPAFIMRANRRYEGVVLKVAMKRLLLAGQGKWNAQWDRSRYIVRPTLEVVLRVLKEMTKKGVRVSYDIETNGEHPLSPKHNVRCIAFHDGKSTICVPFLFRTGEKQLVHVEGKKKPQSRNVWMPYWGKKERSLIGRAIQKLFKTCDLETQNGQYDRLCLEANEDFEVPSAHSGNNFDDILGHHIVASYFPHGLGFLASNYTNAPYYKTTDDGDAWAAGNDEQLWVYCCDDVVVQYQAAAKIRTEVQERPEDIVLYEHDSWQEQECQRWRHVGVMCDPDAVVLLRKHYTEVRERSLAAMKKELARCAGQAAVDSPELVELMERLTAKVEDEDEDGVVELDAHGRAVEKFNPGSLIQLRLLLKHLGIPLTNETATGEISTAKEFLLEARKNLLVNGTKPDAPAIAFLDYLFSWREAAKAEGTYLYPELIPEERGLAWKLNPELRSKLAGKFGIHPTFNPFTVPSGRLASARPNCFDGSTEVLTHSGWCRLDQLPERIHVAQWRDGQVEFVYPTAYVKQESTDWVSLDNQHIDLMVTGDHRCLLRNRKTKKLRVFAARDFPEDWQQLNAASYTPYATWDIDDDILKLVVATQADGYLVEGPRGWSISFTLSKPRKKARLLGILARLNVSFTEATRKQTRGVKGLATRIHIAQCAATATIGTLLGKDKCFKPWVLQLKPAQLKLFAEEAMLWDGCATRLNHYASEHQQNADWVQLAYVLTGRRANVRVYTPRKNSWGGRKPSYQVDVSRNDYSLTTNIKRHDFVGMANSAYCVSVPSSYLLVRRNGKVMVTGNCQNQPADIRGIFMARPGHRLVTGDWSALENRLGAILSGDKALLKIYEDYDKGIGLKPHIVNAAGIFKLPATKDFEEKYPGPYRAAKVFAYAVAYGAGPTTVFDQCRDEMPDLEYEDFLKLYENYKKMYPRLFEFQRDVVLKGSQYQFLETGILARRVYFFERAQGQDSPEASKMQNLPYQGTGADVVSLANRRLMQRVVLPWRKTRLKPGEHLEQLAQVHDELLFEVPERLADEFAAIYKAIAEEPPWKGEKRGEPFKTWKLPVEVKVRKPVVEGAPSRWKDLHYPAPCCGHAATVELDLKASTVDNVVWLGKCKNDRCTKKSDVHVATKRAA